MPLLAKGVPRRLDRFLLPPSPLGDSSDGGEAPSGLVILETPDRRIHIEFTSREADEPMRDAYPRFIGEDLFPSHP